MKTLFTAAIVACLATIASAEPQCGPRDDVTAYLASEFGETRHALMLTAQGAVLEVWGNTSTGTWTVTATGPDNVTCLVADGVAFELVADALPPQGEEM